MSHFARATVAAIFALTFSSVAATAAPPVLSVGGFEQVSSVRVSRTAFYFSYSAILTNTGPAVTGVTATVTSSAPSVTVVPGQGTLEFSPVAAGSLALPSQTNSTNTFTIMVDRSLPFDFSMLSWSLNAPFADPGPAQTVPVLSTVTLNGAGSTNLTGIGALTYSWGFQTLPSGSNAQINNPTNSIATFIPDIVGTYVVTLTVTSGPLSNTGIVTISTTDVPPTANPGPNQTVSLGATVNLDGTKSTDVNGQPLTFSWSFVGLPNGSNAVLSNSRGSTLSFVADKAGAYIVGLVVNDGTLPSSLATVTVTTGNTPPVAVATANPQTVKVNGIVQLDGSQSTDVDGNPLTYSWSLNVPAGSNATLSNPNIVNPTFTADVSGTYIAQLIVNDGIANSKATTVTATTSTVLAPTANAGPNQKILVGTTAQLNGSGNDPQGLALTYQWSFTTLPAGSTATISNPNIPNPAFVADVPGTYALLLVVNNGALSSSNLNPSATVTITSTSSPPVAVPTTSTPTVSLGVTVTLDGSQSTDPDGLPVTYMWSLSVPPGSSATLSNPTSVSASFTPDAVGTYVAQLIVSDKFAGSQPVTLSIGAGQMTLSLSPSPLNLTVSPVPLTVTASPGAGNTPITVGLSGYDSSVISLSSNTVTIAANTSSANVTVTPVGSGNTGIIAAAAGFAAVGDSVSVTVPSIGLTFNNNAAGVGLTHTLRGTVTLGTAAPPSGVTVNFSLGQGSGAVSFNPASVMIPGGSATGSFSITGTQTGNANILANASGYGQGSASLLVVTLGGISVSQNLAVGVSQSAPLSVTLSTPAPVDGETVNLVIGDSTKISVSPATLTFAPGSKTPDTAPQVTGIAIGSSTITANGGGYASDTETVGVTASVSFSVPTLAVGVGAQQPFNVNLSSPAPAPGVTVTLSSNNSDATVTPSVTIATNQTFGQAQVTGVSAGVSTITATTNNPSVSATGVSLTVTITNSLVLNCPATTNGEVGAPFSSQMSASGGVQAYTYTVVGTLPAGLALSASGLVSGTPTASGTFNIQVKDNTGATAASCLITIANALSLPAPSTTSGELGTAFSVQLAPTGGITPYTYSVVGAALPGGLTLSALGAITGTPTASGVFTIQVKDAIGVTVQSPAFTINGSISLPCPGTTTGEVNTPFTVQLSAAGGVSPFTYTVVGTLPLGLTLNSSSGAISGTPTMTGAFTVQVKDATGAIATSCQLTIGAAISLPCPSPVNGELGLAFSTQLSATGGITPYTYTVVGTLPAGLTLSSTGGVSGIPGATGSFSVKVTDAAGGTATSCTFTIGTAVALPCPATIVGDVSTAFSSQVQATGGVAPYTYTVVGTLPAGLTLSGGTVSGTALAAGTFNIKVTDSIGGTATSCLFTISAALAIPCPSTTASDVGSPFSVQLAPTGGSAPYTYSVFGTITPGLTLSATGLVSGTPTQAGSFSVQVKDAAGVSVNSCTFTTSSALSLPCPGTTSGTVGTAFSSQFTASGGSAPYTYTVVGTLPAGLTLSAGGLVSGTPAAGGTFNIQVKDAAGVTMQSCLITINGSLSLPCPATTNGEVGQPFSAQLAPAGGATPYTYTVIGTLPANLTVSATGLISGTPTTASSFTVQVRDANGATATSCQITIAAALSMPCPATVTGEVGLAFSSQLAASGGVGPYTYSVVGSLPTNLTLSAGGLVSGTPTTAGNFTIQVKDALGVTVTSCQITIAAALALPCPATTSGETGIAFSSQLAASGGVLPYTYTVVGTLPTNLTLSAGGLVSGTPTSAGNFNIQVKDALGVTLTSCQFTIIGTVTVPCPATTNGEVGVPFSAQLLPAGGTTPYTYTVVGTLPGSLTLSTGGLISGTPSTAGSFSVQVKDAQGNTATSCTFTIAAKVTLAPPSTTNGEAGIAFTSQVTASNGVTPYTYAVVGTLPSGLNLNAGTGAITGSTSSPGSFAVKVTDSLAATATSSQITIAAAVSLTCPATTTGDAGSPFSAQLNLTGGVGPFTYAAVGPLPGGLTISSTGLVSGTPAAAGSFSVKVTDSLGGTATSCTFVISGGISMPCPAVVNGEVGAAFSTQFTATGGTTPYTYSVVGGTLPGGLTLNSANGAISGTPGAAGSFSVQVKDANNATLTSSCSVTIATTVALTCPATTSGTVGTAFSATMTGSGGILPYGFSLSAGTVPAGLSFSAGTISGTPTAPGNFTYKLTDGDNVTAANSCAFTIANVALQITTANPLPNGAPGTLFDTTIQAIGGTKPYTWSLGTGAPTFLSINASTGELSGTPRSAGTFSVPVTVTDSTLPTHNSITVTFNLAISTAPLTFTTTSLPNATQNAAYSQPITVTGGTTPYNYSIAWVSPTTAPTWFAFDPTGAACGSNVASICGTPPTFGTISFTVSVIDSSSPNPQTASETYTLTIQTPNGLAALSLVGGSGNSSAFSVGQYLEVPITLSFSPTPPGGVSLQISSDSLGAITFTGTPIPNGNNPPPAANTFQITTLNSPGPAVSIYLQALASSGTFHVTATSPGYQSSTATVTLTPSAFVLSGPNGIGGSFSTFEGITTPLTLGPARLDSSNLFVEYQDVAYGQSFSVPLTVSPSSLGTDSPSSITFSSGTASQVGGSGGPNFIASSFNSGGATISISQPPGFTLPAVGSSLNAAVQQSGYVLPAVTVGNNLQVQTSVSFSGPTASAGSVTITSNDATRLLFSATETGASTNTLVLSVAKGETSAPGFWVRGYEQPGDQATETVGYGISNSQFGNTTGNVTLGPSGIVIQGPGGGSSFTVSNTTPSATMTLSTALLNSTGGIVASQEIAADQTLSITVTSGSTNIGTISSSPLTIPTFSQQIVNGKPITTENTTASTTFVPVPGATGSSTITASATGFQPSGASVQSATATATVTGCTLNVANGLIIGKFLEAQGTAFSSCAAPAGGTLVTLTSNSQYLMLAVNPTDAGSSSISLTMQPGSHTVNYWIYALGDGETAGPQTATYTASAAGVSGTDTVTLAPSAILISAPNFGANSDSASGGAVTVTLWTDVLTNDGTNTPQASTLQQEGIAGNVGLVLSLSDSARGGAGTLSANTVTLTPGSVAATVNFTPANVGQTTTLSVAQPAGWSITPANPIGLFMGMYDFTTSQVTVTQ